MITLNNNMSITEINNALKNNREIKFSSGTYKITSCMKVYSNTKITCAKNVIFERHHDGRMMQSYISPSYDEYNGVHDVEWNGGKFIANTNTEKGANVITFFHCNNIKLSNITIDGCVNLHSIEINACQNVTIDNCTISNQSYKSGEGYREGIQLDFANLDGLTVSKADGNSKCYDGTHNNNITITNCTFSNCPNGIGTHTVGEQIKYHTNINIIDCIFKNIKTADIKLVGFKDVNISGCKYSSKGKVIINKLTTAHKLSGGKVNINERGNINVKIDNITII